MKKRMIPVCLAALLTVGCVQRAAQVSSEDTEASCETTCIEIRQEETPADTGAAGAGAETAGTASAGTESAGTESAGAESNGPENFWETYRIADQSFSVNLGGWGEVEFVSVEPDGEERRDVTFYLEKEGQIVYAFPAVDAAGFKQVLAVSFRDFNRDGKQDVIAVIEREQETGGTCRTCVVYQQENEADAETLENGWLKGYQIAGPSEAGPAFYRDTFLEEYLAKQELTDSIGTVMDSYPGYRRYVGSLCLKEETDAEFPLHFIFSSGAGAWSTELTLYADGSFSGLYNDSDMGDSGEGYPDGTRYTCVFSGEFGDLVKLNGYSYAMTLKDLTAERSAGEEWLEDGVRYISSEAYGIEGGNEFIFYTPQTPLSELSEEFLLWHQSYLPKNPDPEMLGCYGIRNVKLEQGFFTYD